MIFTLQSHEIAKHWNEIEPFLFDHYEWSREDIKHELETAQAQLWGLVERSGIQGILITKLMPPIGLLWIASGKGLEPGMELLWVVEQWMKDKGIRDVKIEGRRGWGRVLDGYEEKATVFLKRLQ